MVYARTFRVRGRDVIHAVEMSPYPDWAGTEQRRHVELTQGGDRMTLSIEPMPASGQMVRHHLYWKRIDG